MLTSISTILIPCLKSFNQLQERVEGSGYSYEEEVSSVSWRDELGRLRVWAANIGAHQTGLSSLDFRLRDASHISTQIKKLLRDLDHSLNEIADELSGDGTRISENEDDENETPAAWPNDNTTTELQQLYEEVVNIIDCLYQLSMLIRKPAQHDLLVGSRKDDKAEFEFYDKEHVRNLHPKTEEQISRRLGCAITRRRKYLYYRERHHRKLEKGIEEVQGIQQTTTGSVISETIATNFKPQHIDFEETSSNSGMSFTSYAPSLADGGRITIPPPPKDSVGGKPFECPYCFFLIEIKSTRSWNRHVFKDLKPYVCTFSDCRMPDRLYDSRRDWYLHERTEHRREDYVCALCKETLRSSKQYERHVARHCEELALFALPRSEMDDAENDGKDVSDTEASTSEVGAALDSPSGGSSVEGDEGKAGLNASISTGGMDDIPSSSSPPTHSETTENIHQKRIPMAISALKWAEVAVVAAEEQADRTSQAAAKGAKAAATLEGDALGKGVAQDSNNAQAKKAGEGLKGKSTGEYHAKEPPEENKDDLPLVRRRRTLDEKESEEDVERGMITPGSRQGSEAVARPVNRSRGLSDDADGLNVNPPFMKKAPFGPYHHYCGSQVTEGALRSNTLEVDQRPAKERKRPLAELLSFSQSTLPTHESTSENAPSIPKQSEEPKSR